MWNIEFFLLVAIFPILSENKNRVELEAKVLA
jgi:hypothetical protein